MRHLAGQRQCGIGGAVLGPAGCQAAGPAVERKDGRGRAGRLVGVEQIDAVAMRRGADAGDVTRRTPALRHRLSDGLGSRDPEIVHVALDVARLAV